MSRAPESTVWVVLGKFALDASAHWHIYGVASSRQRARERVRTLRRGLPLGRFRVVPYVRRKEPKGGR